MSGAVSCGNNVGGLSVVSTISKKQTRSLVYLNKWIRRQDSSRSQDISNPEELGRMLVEEFGVQGTDDENHQLFEKLIVCR